MRRNEYVILLLLFIGVGLHSCFSSKNNDQVYVKRAYAQSTSFYDVGFVKDTSKFTKRLLRGECRKVDNFFYNEEYPFLHEKKTIRVNFHFVNSKDSTHNFNPDKGVKYAQQLVYYANGKLRENPKMKLPEGNDTPVHPIPFRYKLMDDEKGPENKAIYFHYLDDPFFVNSGKNSNNYDRTLINELAIGSDSILNIFYMVHHPDSVKSKKYKSTAAGIALGHSVKLGINGSKKVNPWTHAGLLNHEIGHVLSLHHSWIRNDGCDDTPPHPNCWNKGPSPCDGTISNNVMDYNSTQVAYSPCQIAKTYNLMMNEKSSKRNLVIKDWCTYKKEKTVVVRDTQIWSRGVDICGDIIIEENGLLMSNCFINMPEKSKILIKGGGKLVLNNATIKNDCDRDWQGIFVEESSKSVGYVSFIDTFYLENAGVGGELID